MSLVREVVQAILARGSASLDDVASLFPNHTRLQLHNALINARDARRLRMKVKADKRSKTVWEPTERALVTLRRSPDRAVFPVSSVFTLGDAEEWRGAWPPLDAGRRFEPLGGWD